MDLFEGLEDQSSNLQEDSVSRAQQFHGVCGIQQVLLCEGTTPAPLLVHLSARCPEPKITGPAGQQTGAANSPIQLHAAVHRLAVAGYGSQLLALCEQPSACFSFGTASSYGHWPACLAAIAMPCWLALSRQGSKLQLHGVQPHQPQLNPQHGNSATQLLVELEHDSFQGLTTEQCWLGPGPLLLLQPQPECILVLSPAASRQAAAVAGHQYSSGAPAPSAAATAEPGLWQVTELSVSAANVLQSVQQQLRAAEPAAAYQGGLGPSGRLQVLHASLRAHSSMNLLCCLPVMPAKRSRTLQHRGHQQQTLLVWLLVRLCDGLCGPATATTTGALVGADPEVAANEPVTVSCSYTVDWASVPACEAIPSSSCSNQGSRRQQCNCSVAALGQAVAVGSSTGSLKLLSVVCSHHNDQQQQQYNTKRIVTLQASAELSGPVTSIRHLPQANIAGAVHQSILAVLHSESAGSKVVSFLNQQGQQLVKLGEVQNAAALIAPRYPVMGLSCPLQVGPSEQQQQQHPVQQQQSHQLDPNAVQLAALVLLCGNGQAVFVGCHAFMPGKAVQLVPGPILGVLRELPKNIDSAAVHKGGAASVAQISAGSSSLNELRGMQAMLKVLEARWQQETSDVVALQTRHAAAQQVANAAHRRLCQLSADRLQGSLARQYSLPFTHVDQSAAMAVYQAGCKVEQDMVQRQQQQQQGLVTEAGGRCTNHDLQLTLQFHSMQSQLVGDVLQLTVCIKPILYLQQCLQHVLHLQPEHQQRRTCEQQLHGHNVATAANSCASDSFDSSNSGRICWWGPLLRVCHAEVLLWHARGTVLAAQSSWQWDAVSGHLTLQASITRQQVLRLAAACTSQQNAQHNKAHSMGTAPPGSTTLHPAGMQPRATTVGYGASNSTDDAYVEVATAMADAVAKAVGCGSCNSSGVSSTSRASSEKSVHLQAAVVAAASCSAQAVVRLECQQQQQAAAIPAAIGPIATAAAVQIPEHVSAVQQVLQRSQLLTPATAVLHLQPVAVPVQQLLLQQLAGTPVTLTSVGQYAGCHQLQQQQPEQQKPTLNIGTPQPMQQVQQLALCIGSPNCAQQHNVVAGDVIPPTPSSVAAGGDMHDGDMVIEDSEQSGDDQQHSGDASEKQLIGDIADVQPAPAPGSPASAWADASPPVAAGLPNNTPSHKQLLFQSSTTELQSLPSVLQQHFGFAVVCSTCSDIPGGGTCELAGTAGVSVTRSLSQLQYFILEPRSQQQNSFHCKHSSSNKSTACRSSSSMELAVFSNQVVHIQLNAATADGLETLQQLLLLGVKQLPGGGADVSCQLSPLSAAVLARQAAAIDALSQAVTLHCQVIQATLLARTACKNATLDPDAAMSSCWQSKGQQAASTAAGAAAGPAGAEAARAAVKSQESLPPAEVQLTDLKGGSNGKRPIIAGSNTSNTSAALEGVHGRAQKGSEGVLFVNGHDMGVELAAAWVVLYESLADAGLAMMHLGA